MAAYSSDVTYSTNNELGFDYLRDNMKSELDQVFQKYHNFAIVDEVDSILIDEARTPLIISGPAQDRSDLYVAIDAVIPSLSDDHYELDEKSRNVTFTDEGNEFLEEQLKARGLLEAEQSLYDPESTTVVHHVNQGLRAHKLFTRDKDYIVRDGEIVLIDEFTGRMMPGRRLSDGLHQAIEAKENAQIQPENVTLASVTFQNYFRLYDKLSGMTGTAATEAEEFGEIYNLGVVEVPTNRPIARADEDDQVYRTAKEKYEAMIREIKQANEKGQPVLAGTTSIEKSEMLSQMLDGRRDQAQRPERPPARARSADRRGCGPAGRSDHRHQHGGPRHRHSVGRQRRNERAGRDRSRPRSRPGRAARQRRGAPRGRKAKGARSRWSVCSGLRTARKPPHRQPAARPFGSSGRPRSHCVLPEPRRRPDARSLGPSVWTRC